MSLFLAPIHQIMYDKIHYADALARAIAEKDEAIAASLEEQFPAIEREALEEVIDTSNIHGWLAERVELAERRLAFAATQLAKKDKNALLATLREMGVDENFTGDAEDAYRLYDGHFLNGMPCDRVHLPVPAEEGFMWRVTQDVHGGYYDDPALYGEMIDAWWEGLLEKTPLRYERTEDARYIR